MTTPPVLNVVTSVWKMGQCDQPNTHSNYNSNLSLVKLVVGVRRFSNASDKLFIEGVPPSNPLQSGHNSVTNENFWHVYTTNQKYCWTAYLRGKRWVPILQAVGSNPVYGELKWGKEGDSALTQPLRWHGNTVRHEPWEWRLMITWLCNRCY